MNLIRHIPIFSASSSSRRARWGEGGGITDEEEREEVVLKEIGFMPDDLVTEILEWVPVKSIIRFRCVSKSWCALFGDRTFKTNHCLKLKKAESRSSGSMLLLRRRLPPPQFNNKPYVSRDDLVEVFSFHDLESPEREVRPAQHASDFLQHLEGGYIQGEQNALRFLGCIHGIVCFTYVLRPYILCNPTLREYKILPMFLCDSPNEDYFPKMVADGFGISEDDDFKIIVMHKFLHKQDGPSLPIVVADLYTMRTNSWRRLGNAPVIPVMPHPLNSVFFKGACHWCGSKYGADDKKLILSFDMTSEVFRLLELPNHLEKAGFCPHPIVLDNCLGVVQYNNWESMTVPFEIWVMKEYGVKESWTKQFVISPQPYRTALLPWKNDTMLMLQQHRPPPRHRTWNLTGFKLNSRDQLTSIDLHTSEMREFEVLGASCSLCGLIYEESLVTLN